MIPKRLKLVRDYQALKVYSDKAILGYTPNSKHLTMKEKGREISNSLNDV